MSIEDPEPLPDELIARAEDSRTVNETLQKLSPHFREILLLRYMDHLTFEEIAEVLGEPSNTVRSRHRRGLIQLRQAFGSLHQKEL